MSGDGRERDGEWRRKLTNGSSPLRKPDEHRASDGVRQSGKSSIQLRCFHLTLLLINHRAKSISASARRFLNDESSLTGDHLVTYYSAMLDDEKVFKALADSSRRLLLDLLYERDGRTLGELEKPLVMSRFGVMKHLRVLENAGLLTTRRVGREKHHFLNAVPIRLIHDRWIDKYTVPHVAALTELKATLEGAKWKTARKRA